MGTKKKQSLEKFNKDNILSAAKILFEKKGIALTTVDDIAKEADCSKSTMYVYFQGKADIINHIILEQMTHLKEIIQECVEMEQDFTKSYELICQKLVSYQEEYPIYFDLLLGEIKVTEEDFANHTVNEKIYIVGEELNDIIESFLQRGMNAGILKKDLEMIPTIFYLWSGISEIIRFADQKNEYLKMRVQMNKQDYMKYAFSLLYHSLLK